MSAPFAIVCPDYRIECVSREQAERRLAGIAKFGRCSHEHTIEERKP